jgi:sulfur carrier protein ThiS
MNLNPTNAFGELLLDLIEAQYGAIDNGIMALMQTTGLSEEEVVAIINGDVVIEDQNLLSTIIQAFPDADADDISLVIDVAVGVEEADRAELEGAIQETQVQDNDYGQEEGAYPAAAGGGEGGEAGGFAHTNMNANFNALKNTVLQQQNQINQLTAGISNFQAVEGLQERLKDVNSVAESYVVNGILPPSYKSMLVGNFTNDKQRLAQFSAIADKNGVDLPTMLFATEYALGMLSEASQFVEFSDYSLSEEDVQLANFSANLDVVVAKDVEAIFNS